jgi:cytochrome b
MNNHSPGDVTASHSSVKAWDWPTRAFHWLLVLCIISAWVSFNFAGPLGDPTLKWHRWNGYAILVLVAFRLIWGFAGSSTSQFRAFVRSPSHIIAYALDNLRGRNRHFLGHNPLGSVMILLLLGAVITQSVLGLYTLEHNEITAGPLQRTLTEEMSNLVSKLHARGFNITLGLVAVHIVANSLHGLIKQDPVLKAMLTGQKPAMPYEDSGEAVIAPHLGLRVILAFAMANVIVFGSIALLGGRIL